MDAFDGSIGEGKGEWTRRWKFRRRRRRHCHATTTIGKWKTGINRAVLAATPPKLVISDELFLLSFEFILMTLRASWREVRERANDTVAARTRDATLKGGGGWIYRVCEGRSRDYVDVESIKEGINRGVWFLSDEGCWGRLLWFSHFSLIADCRSWITNYSLITCKVQCMRLIMKYSLIV